MGQLVGQQLGAGGLARAELVAREVDVAAGRERAGVDGSSEISRGRVGVQTNIAERVTERGSELLACLRVERRAASARAVDHRLDVGMDATGRQQPRPVSGKVCESPVAHRRRDPCHGVEGRLELGGRVDFFTPALLATPVVPTLPPVFPVGHSTSIRPARRVAKIRGELGGLGVCSRQVRWTGKARGSAHRPGGLWGRLLGARRDPEQRLLAEARAGRAEAFDRIRAQHEEGITSFCRMMLEERSHEAEGVAEEAFATARRELPQAPRDGPLRPWLYAVAYERCVARLHESGAPDHTTASEQGDEAEQRRGAALMVGTLPDAEVATLIGLGATRPALFGLVGEVARGAPHLVTGFATQLAAEKAVTEAVTALARSTSKGGGRPGTGAEAARQVAGAPRVGSSSGGALHGADRVRRAATAAALTGSVAVAAGAGVYAVADSQRTRDGDRTGVVAPGATGGSSAPGARPSLGIGSAGTTAGRLGDSVGPRRRAGRAGRTNVIRLPGRAGAGGRDGTSGRGGPGGRDGAAGPGGRSGEPVRDPSRFLTPGGPGGGPGAGPGPGGGPRPPRRDPLVSVDARVGPAHARVEIPPSE